MSAKLSVNINKIATLRNSRGGNNPDIVKVARDCQRFGADGITVHPRPDERHIRYEDVRQIKKVMTTEFNIEGNPLEDKFVSLVLEVRPEQVTLVPDAPGQLTSNHGWDTIRKGDYLRTIIPVFKDAGIRVSIFVDPVADLIAAAAETGADRIELYTEDYAKDFHKNSRQSVAKYVTAAGIALSKGLGINAGHDLDMDNLGYFFVNVPGLLEVSIGHALICDSIYYGIENVIQLYKQKIAPGRI